MHYIRCYVPYVDPQASVSDLGATRPAVPQGCHQGGQNNGTPRFPWGKPQSWTCALPGKRDFEDVFKSRILKWGEYLGSYEWFIPSQGSLWGGGRVRSEKEWCHCWGATRQGTQVSPEARRDGGMASLTPRTWVWANSGRQWRPGRPGVLPSLGSQRVGHNWATTQRAEARKSKDTDSGNGTRPCQQLDYRTSDLQNGTVINPCCFQPPSLWSLVTAATGSWHSHLPELLEREVPAFFHLCLYFLFLWLSSYVYSNFLHRFHQYITVYSVLWLSILLNKQNHSKEWPTCR